MTVKNEIRKWGEEECGKQPDFFISKCLFPQEVQHRHHGGPGKSDPYPSDQEKPGRIGKEHFLKVRNGLEGTRDMAD